MSVNKLCKSTLGSGYSFRKGKENEGIRTLRLEAYKSAFGLVRDWIKSDSHAPMPRFKIGIGCSDRSKSMRIVSIKTQRRFPMFFIFDLRRYAAKWPIEVRAKIELSFNLDNNYSLSSNLTPSYKSFKEISNSTAAKDKTESSESR